MNATREQQKAEAIERMKAWGIIGDAIQQFRHDDKVMVSEGGMLYWLDDEQKKAVEEFEAESGGLVYMVIHNHTEFGELYSMLFVGKDKADWATDRSDIADGYAFAYVKNVTDEWCSEYGTIGVENRFGGLVRVS